MLLLRGTYLMVNSTTQQLQRQRQPPIAIQKSNLTRLLYNLHAMMPEMKKSSFFPFQQIKVILAIVIIIIFVCFNCSVHLFLLLPFLPPCHAELVLLLGNYGLDRRPVIGGGKILDTIFFLMLSSKNKTVIKNGKIMDDVIELAIIKNIYLKVMQTNSSTAFKLLQLHYVKNGYVN